MKHIRNEKNVSFVQRFSNGSLVTKFHHIVLYPSNSICSLYRKLQVHPCSQKLYIHFRVLYSLVREGILVHFLINPGKEINMLLEVSNNDFFKKVILHKQKLLLNILHS